MAEYAQKCVVKTKSAAYMTTLLRDICNDLYLQEPKDDTTVAVARVGVRKIVHILTGPPKDNRKDEETPPISIIEGIDLVTEGAVTLGRVLELLQQYERNDLRNDFLMSWKRKMVHLVSQKY